MEAAGIGTPLLSAAIQYIINVIMTIPAILYVDKWGRRPIYLVSTAGTLITYVIWTACSAKYADTNETSYGSGVLAMIFLYSLAYNIK